MSHDSADEPVTPPRKRRWLRWLVGTLVTFLVVATIQYFVRLSIANERLAKVIAATDAADPRWRFEDIQADRAVIPPEKNGALVAVAAAKLIDPKSLEDRSLQRQFEIKPIERRLNEPQRKAVRAFVEKNAGALRIARTLKDFPGGRFDIKYTPEWFSTQMDELESLRLAGDLLEFDVMNRIDRSEWNGASASALALFHAGTVVGDEPLSCVQICRCARVILAMESLERILGNGELSAVDLAHWQKRIAEEESQNLFLLVARGERAGGFRFFDGLRTGKFNLQPLESPRASYAGQTWRERWFQLWKPEFFATQQIVFLDKANELVQIASKPMDKRPVLVSGPAGIYCGHIGDWDELAHHLSPDFQWTGRIYPRHRSFLVCARTALAAEQYRLTQKKWPGAIAELVEAGLLPEVPVDPYDGKPLRIAKNKTGITIYSVYENRTDDGGRSIRSHKVRPDDIGFQLWDPTHRGAEPLPPAKEDEAVDGEP